MGKKRFMNRLVVGTKKWNGIIARYNFYPVTQRNGTVLMVSENSEYYYE